MKRHPKSSIVFWWGVAYPLAVCMAIRTFFQCLGIRDAANEAWEDLTGDFQLITKNAKRLWRGESTAD